MAPKAALYPASNTALYGYNMPPPPGGQATYPAAGQPPPEGVEQPPEAEFAARPLTLELRLGLGAPTGLYGFGAIYSPIPAFGFDCGAGTNGVGIQLSCGLHARLVLGSREHLFGQQWARAVTLSSGVSGGRYVDEHWFENVSAVDGKGPATLHFARAYWWNTDLGVEIRTGAFVGRVFFGLAVLLNRDAYTVVKPSTDSRVELPSTTLLYLGTSWGIAP